MGRHLEVVSVAHRRGAGAPAYDARPRGGGEEHAAGRGEEEGEDEHRLHLLRAGGGVFAAKVL